MDIRQEAVKFLAEYLEMNPEEMVMEANLVDDLGVDPGEVVGMVHQLAERLGMEIPEEEMAKVRTVGDLVNLVEAYA